MNSCSDDVCKQFRCWSFCRLSLLLPYSSLPGDPVDVLVGNAQKDMAPAEIQVLRQEFGLDKSPVEQYLLWLSNGVLKGNLGRSYKDGRPVVTIILERLPSTFRLVATALVLAFAIGMFWGLLDGSLEAVSSWKNGWRRRSSSLPHFVLLLQGFGLALWRCHWLDE